MKNSMTWMIKLGIILSIAGLILMIIILLFYIHLGMPSQQHTDREDFDLQIFFFRVYGIVGIVLFLVGISLYITGMRDLYFKPLKYLLYPQFKMKGPFKIPINIKLQSIDCTNCEREIPLDSVLCPYCGMKQKDRDSITLKGQ